MATGVAGLVGVAITGIGARFLMAPEAAAADYGVPATDSDAWLEAKGVRDLGAGAITLTLLATGQRQALGWALVAASAIPLGDALLVRRHGGSSAQAWGVHGTTAGVMVAAGAVLANADARPVR